MKEIKVRNYYDNFSTNYNSFYEKIQFEKFIYVQNKICSIDFEEIIDLGGGSALLSKFLNFKLLTLDISYKMVKNGLDNKYTDLVIVGDMSKLPIRRSYYKAILSFTAIQNVKNTSQSIEEISRIKTNNCKIIVSGLKKIINIEIIQNIKGFENRIIHFPIEDIGFINF